MTLPCLVAVQAVDGRPYTQATIEALHSIGGARRLELPPVLCWTAIAPPSFELPPDWSLCHWVQQPAGHRRDLWRIFGIVSGGQDLVVFEDDVIPCRNAVDYIARFPAQHFTTFFRMRPANKRGDLLEGTHQLDPAWGFWGTQAIKVPARLVARLVAAGDTDTSKPTFRNDGGDTRISRLLMQWREPVHYHRSLVQHVGAISTHNPRATLTGLRAPAKDFDPDLDALAL